MTTPFINSVRGHPRGAAPSPPGPKRGRKPRGSLTTAVPSTRPLTQDPPPPSTTLFIGVHLSQPVQLLLSLLLPPPSVAASGRSSLSAYRLRWPSPFQEPTFPASTLNLR